MSSEKSNSLNVKIYITDFKTDYLAVHNFSNFLDSVNIYTMWESWYGQKTATFRLRKGVLKSSKSEPTCMVEVSSLYSFNLGKKSLRL